MSNYLNDDLQANDKLTVAGPFGDFVLKPDESEQTKPIIFIAAGSGITPILPMLQRVLDANNERQVKLIYCNHSMDSTMFLQRIDELCHEYPSQLSVKLIVKKGVASDTVAVGRLNETILTHIVSTFTHEINHLQCFICGPRLLKDMAKRTLRELGVQENNLMSEDYALVTKLPKGRLFNVAIEDVSGQQHCFSVAENQTVLEVAKQEGINLPHACGVGQCGCCMLKIEKGVEAFSSNNMVALLPAERDDGLTLACQCQPRSDLYLKELR